MSRNRKEYIFDFLVELNKTTAHSAYAVTGSFSLYLHSILHKNTFPRQVKDLDICVFGRTSLFQHQKYLDQFSIKNNQAHHLNFNDPDFYMDVFSSGYLADTIFPCERDLISIEIKGVKLQISSVEHILMLKLCSTCGFKNTKNLFDVKYILHNYSIDQEKCNNLLLRSHFKDLQINLNNLYKPGRLNLLLAEISRKITKKYAEIPVDLQQIDYEHLVTLQHFTPEELKIDTPKARILSLLSDELGSNGKRNELYILAYLYLTAGITEPPIELFTCIIKATSKFIQDNHQQDSLLMMARHANRLLRNAVPEKQINELLEKPKYLVNYLALYNKAINNQP